MPNSIRATLEHTAVQSVHIDIDTTMFADAEITFSLEASAKSQLRVPIEKEDNSFLLVSTLEVKSKEFPNFMSASIIVEFYFATNQHIDDYDDVVREQCLPLIQKESTTLINKILSNMGYPEFLRIKE